MDGEVYVLIQIWETYFDVRALVMVDGIILGLSYRNVVCLIHLEFILHYVLLYDWLTIGS